MRISVKIKPKFIWTEENIIGCTVYYTRSSIERDAGAPIKIINGKPYISSYPFQGNALEIFVNELNSGHKRVAAIERPNGQIIYF